MNDRCHVCGAPLPRLTLDQRQRGGRPRRFCALPARCKLKADRRARTLARLTRWHAGAVTRGHHALANELAVRMERLSAAPFTTTVLPALSQETLRTVYDEQQRRARAQAMGLQE
jgi:hypothetical protein